MRLLFLTIVILWSGNSGALTLEAGTMAGIMVQPNSQYYHVAGGGYAGLALPDRWIVGRMYYIQRPEHNSQGFKDSDAGTFYTLGQEAWRMDPWFLFLWLGRGSMAGYLRQDSSSTERSYHIWGYAAGMESGWRSGSFEISLGHISFAGLDGDNQIKAYVAWPFSFFTLNFGFMI